MQYARIATLGRRRLQNSGEDRRDAMTRNGQIADHHSSSTPEVHTLSAGSDGLRTSCRRWNILFGSLGLCAALAIVILWFPSNLWHLPIENSDAAAHYYFINKLGSQGMGALTGLWPNGDFYPPLFHVLAHLIQVFSSLIGLQCSVFTAFSLVWIITSGVVFPLGMLLFCNYFLGNMDSEDTPRVYSRWTHRLLLLAIPVLSVSSASHPFGMLMHGPLIAFGLGTSLLPFGLYATLKLFDSIAREPPSYTEVATRIMETLVCIALLLLSHPRIAFSFALLIGAFIVLRLPRKVAIAGVATIVTGAVAYVLLVLATETSHRLGDPAQWFHSHRPSMTVPEALETIVSNGLDASVGFVFALLLVFCSIVAVAFSKAGRQRSNSVALVMNVVFLSVVFVATVHSTGAVANLVSAPWYRDENRIIAMLPLTTLPLICAGFAALMSRIADSHDTQYSNRSVGNDSSATSNRAVGRTLSSVVKARGDIFLSSAAAICAIALISVTFGAQAIDSTRSEFATRIQEAANLDKPHPTEQLTRAKYDALRDVVAHTGTQAVIVSDPMNGSMYAGPLFGARMLYPIINPKSSGEGAIFAHVQEAFASGDSQLLSRTFCSIAPGNPTYFLTLGPQAPSLQSFPFKDQYNVFHDDNLIGRYVGTGALTPVRNYGDLSGNGQESTLYEVNCHH
jgi:hypothetical protein